MHLLFFWSRSLVLLNKSRILLNKSRILLNKSRILILHPHFSGPIGANDYYVIYTFSLFLILYTSTTKTWVWMSARWFPLRWFWLPPAATRLSLKSSLMVLLLTNNVFSLSSKSVFGIYWPEFECCL